MMVQFARQPPGITKIKPVNTFFLSFVVHEVLLTEICFQRLFVRKILKFKAFHHIGALFLLSHYERGGKNMYFGQIGFCYVDF